MPSISGLLDIGKRSLLANQTALLVISHNIANVNTPGYARQEAVFAEADPENSSPGQIGRGVTVTGIKKYFDRFIDFQMKSESQNYGRLNSEKDALKRIEMIFSDQDNIGINNAIDQFFNTLQDLSNNPQGTAERTNLLAKGQNLASAINKAYTNLEQVGNDLNKDLSGNITEINKISSDIAMLNDKISKAEISGMQANDFRDQRSELLKKMSEMIDVNYYEDNLGQLTVMVGGKSPVVEARISRSLVAVTNTNNSGMYDVGFEIGSNNVVNITNDITNGSVKGILNQRDVTIPEYKDDLNKLAAAITDQINGQHQVGYGLDGTTGNLFFTAYSSPGNAASEMSVAISDTNKIAASSSSSSLPGDNTNALLMSEIQSSLVLNNGGSTFNTFYRSMVERVGVQSSNAQGDFKIQTVVQNQLDNIRESISGVSLDEETANLIKYQQAFQASAKLITLSDDLMNIIIRMKSG